MGFTAPLLDELLLELVVAPVETLVDETLVLDVEALAPLEDVLVLSEVLVVPREEVPVLPDDVIPLLPLLNAEELLGDPLPELPLEEPEDGEELEADADDEETDDDEDVEFVDAAAEVESLELPDPPVGMHATINTDGKMTRYERPSRPMGISLLCFAHWLYQHC